MKVHRLARVMFCVSLAFALTACQAEMQVLIYVNDIMDLLKSGTGTTDIKATVNIQIPSEDSRDQMLGVLQGYFRNIDNVKTLTKDMNTFLSFSSSFPMIYVGSKTQFEMPSDMLAIIIANAETGGPLLEIGINKNQLEKLNAYVKDQYYQSITIDEMTLSAIVNNDSRSDYKIQAQAVYLNEKPTPFAKEVVLKRREEVNIRLSDVLRDSIKDSDFVEFAQLQP
jgi:hypothetical protein